MDITFSYHLKADLRKLVLNQTIEENHQFLLLRSRGILPKACFVNREKQVRVFQSTSVLKFDFRFELARPSVAIDLHCRLSCQNLRVRTLLCKSLARLSFSGALLFGLCQGFAIRGFLRARAVPNDRLSEMAAPNLPSN